ncbi:MAG: hypothetical protein IJL15_06140 [Clostridia bacterium]|nr:hypothetical protein [Clostridia bacterium]
MMRLPAALEQALSQNSLSHALLLTGDHERQLKDAAFLLAKRLLCPTPKGAYPCGTCRSCRSFDASSNPDLLLIEPDRTSIKIDQIRTLREEALLSPMGSVRRAALISQADLMTVQAQNALLKLLEEPPSHLTLILTTSRRSLLLETILSRVAVYALNCKEDSPSLTLAEILLTRLLERDRYGLLALQPELAAKRETFAECCDALCLLCRNLLREKALKTPSPLAAKASTAALVSLPKLALSYRVHAEGAASLPLLATSMLIECWEVLS